MKIKWEALVAMVALVAMGFWLIYQPSSSLYSGEFREGSTLTPYLLGGERGWLEVSASDEGEPTYRFVPRSGHPSEILSQQSLIELLGEDQVRSLEQRESNALFRLFNITSWGSLAWVALGFGAQVVFAGRFLVQWLMSERAGKSTVPDVFWWMSLVGGALLFVYFVWRQDPVGVFGQSSGIVIYARNLRLISKHKHRQEAELSAEQTAEQIAEQMAE